MQVVEFNETTSFRQQLKAVATTGVFLSVHTSNLANSQFLRPGAAVVEIIQRNWGPYDLDKSFQVRCTVKCHRNAASHMLRTIVRGGLCSVCVDS